LVEHHNGIVGVRGSNPLGSTSLRPPRSEDEGCRAEVPGTKAGSYIVLRRVTARQASKMKFFYVYILQSEASHGGFYIGFTEDLKSRLKKHNSGEVPHTAKFRPWRIKTAIAFTEPERAIAFEHYLKSASGRAFAKKRL
jgi:putative endonuclease